MTPLRVLFVVSECVPIVKTGGLGDVAGALPAALRTRGIDVRVLMPRYRAAKAYPAERRPGPFGVPLHGELWTAVYESELPGAVPVYLLEHDAFFDRSGLYGERDADYPDNLGRFALLSRAALGIGHYLGFQPEVIHCHDWQAALTAVYARKPVADGVPATVLTIHNLGYQGRFDLIELPAAGLGWGDVAEVEHHGAINVLKAGVACATQLSTVSPRYAQEIQSPEGGYGLDGALRQRADALVGILNGIDEKRWDPRTDGHIAAPYDAYDLTGKAACKLALQRELGLQPRSDVPLVGLVSRFAHQKGIDIFAGALQYLLPLDLQFAVLGSGEPWAEQLFARLSSEAPHFRARFGLDERLAHVIEAGADLFVMASRYEPCGLNQLYSQRYGTLPVVRAVGGLDDTVEHGRTGFKFVELSGAALARAVASAVDCLRNEPNRFRSMQRAAMTKRMGWDRAAAQYEALYRLSVARTRSAMSP